MLEILSRGNSNSLKSKHRSEPFSTYIIKKKIYNNIALTLIIHAI